MRSVLKMVLKDLRRERRIHPLARYSHGADHFSPANNFGGGESRDFRRQHQVDLQLSVGLKDFFGLEQKTGAADVFGRSLQPALFSQQTIAQRKVQVETTGTKRWDLLSCQ